MRIANRWVVQMESVDSPVASYLLFFFRMSAQRQETRGNTTKSLILKQYHMLSDYRFFLNELHNLCICGEWRRKRGKSKIFQLFCHTRLVISSFIVQINWRSHNPSTFR